MIILDKLLSENNLRTLSGKEDVKANFQNIALSGILNFSAQKIRVSLNEDSFEKNIDSQTLTIESMIKMFNSIFYWNEEQILFFEVEKEISSFLAYVNIRKIAKYSLISVRMSKFLAYKLGLMPFHEIVSLSTNTVDILFDRDRVMICNLLSGISKIHLVSSDLFSHNNFIVSSFMLTDQELSSHLSGVKPVIYKNLTTCIYFDKISPKNVHFNLLTDMGEKLMLRYCKITVKCQRVSKKR